MAPRPLCHHPAPDPVCRGGRGVPCRCGALCRLSAQPSALGGQGHPQHRQTSPCTAPHGHRPSPGPLHASPHIGDWLRSPRLRRSMETPTSPTGSPNTDIHTLTPLSPAQTRSPPALGGPRGLLVLLGEQARCTPPARLRRGVSPWEGGFLHPGFEPQGPRGGPALLPRAALERSRGRGLIALQSLAGTQPTPGAPRGRSQWDRHPSARTAP